MDTCVIVANDLVKKGYTSNTPSEILYPAISKSVGEIVNNNPTMVSFIVNDEDFLPDLFDEMDAAWKIIEEKMLGAEEALAIYEMNEKEYV